MGRHATAPRASIDLLLDREDDDRSGGPLGRALDLGCGRGLYTDRLAQRGWQTVGVDNVPRAIEAAAARGPPGTMFVVGDVTALADTDLGSFDFLDVGCFQGLNRDQRLAAGRAITDLAHPGSTLLMLAFRPRASGRWWAE